MTVTCTRMGWVAALRTQRAAPETSSDEMLIRRIAEGDRLAMRTLFGRHRVPLYRWLLRLVGDDALAEDFLSDVFLDVWRQWYRSAGEHPSLLEVNAGGRPKFSPEWCDDYALARSRHFLRRLPLRRAAMG